MAADYKWVQVDRTVQRTSDSAFIPNDSNNRDWQEFQIWVASGGVPDPVDPPPPPPPLADPSQFTSLPRNLRAALVLMAYYTGHAPENMKRDFRRAYLEFTDP